MFTKEAIQALQEGEAISAAFKALTVSSETKDVVALPSDYKLHDLENHLPLRRRARGVMETSALAAFGEYTLAHKEPGASVFVSPENMTATAVLNLGTPDEPGQTDNRAKLTAKRTAAFDALLAHTTGQQLKQATTLMSQGIAASIAVSGIEVQQHPGEFATGIGLGHFNGETAAGMTMSYLQTNGKGKATVGAAKGGAGATVLKASFSFVW